MRRSEVNQGGTIFNKLVQLLGYADDIDIIGRNIRAIMDAYMKLETEAHQAGLYVNEEKTKFLMKRPSTRTMNLLGTHLEIGDKKLEVVNEQK